MGKNNINSQVASGGSKISNSKNNGNISIKKIRTETAIISFIVGTISSLIASYIYDQLF